MERTYYYVVQVHDGWSIHGGAFAGRNLYASSHDALGEARRLALGLHCVSLRPTGVRIQADDQHWRDAFTFGD